MPDPHGTPDASPSLTERLQDATEALVAASTPGAVFDLVLAAALEALGAVTGAVLLVHGAQDRLEVAATRDHAGAAQTLWQGGPLDRAWPAGDALIRHGPLFLEHTGALMQAYPELAAPLPGARAVLPMRLEQTPLGMIVLDFPEPHAFGVDERRFLRTLAAQCALALGRVRAVGQLEAQVAARTAELEARTLALEEERAALDAFVVYKEAVGSERDVLALARLAVQVVQANLENVSVAYYERDGEVWRARVWSEDVPPEVAAQISAGLPLDAPNFAEATRRREAVFADRWNARDEGLPSATAYGAVAFIPLLIQGEPHSLFVVGMRETPAWTERERAIVRAVARGLGVTLERTEQARALEQERAALAAFARFTEASTQVTDVLVLAGQARDVLRSTLNVEVGYSELEDGLWKGRIFSEDTPQDVVEQARIGFPADLPSFARPFQERGAVFVDGWNADQEGAARTEVYGAAAFYPYFQDDRPQGLLTMGSADSRAWTERDRSVFRAVGRSLELAFERLEQTVRLETQNAELDARTRAVEAFAELTRDLTLLDDPYMFMQRAQQVVLSLLPPGYALYFEPDGERWSLRAQTGTLGNDALQAAANAGLPYHETSNLLTPFTTLTPYYQDQYAQDTDNLDDLVSHLGASATLPVLVEGRRVGVFAVVLFGARRPWAPTERAVLESVVRALGLALERAAASRALAATQRYLRIAAEHAPILLFATDAQGVFTLSEGSLLAKLGLAPGQAVGHAATALFDREPELRAGRRLNRALAGEAAHDLMHFTSSDVTLETWFTPIKNEAGTVTEVVGVSLDVTERLNIQRRIEQANEELRRSNAELEQFTYVASHDLQEPLRTVTSFSQLLASKYAGQLDDKATLYLRLMVEGTTRMSQLLQDLLAYARVTSAAQAPVPVNSGQLVRQVAQDLSAQIERTGASVQVGALPPVLGDASQVRQLFQNLIGNALKFGAPDRAPVVRIGARLDGDFVHFEVSDNGIGIAPEFFERIFTIFQRLHTREHYEGNGIGLSITRKIVERHGGRLWLESTSGQGTSFFFTLPSAGEA